MPDKKKWDGKGEPPSDDAAVAWLIEQGVPKADAEALRLDMPNYSRSRGDYYRNRLRDHKANPSKSGSLPPYVSPEKQKAEATARTNNRKATAAKNKVDANDDGSIDPNEAAAADPDDLEAAIAAGPTVTGGRGAALWPYDGDPDAMAGIKVTNKSWGDKTGAKPGEQIGARYYEADTWAPLKWSEEKRAKLQRQLFELGLYGDTPVRLGVWTANDQAVLAELLTAANIEGRKWADQLRYWRTNPPVDLLAKIKGQGGGEPTIRVTNPIDIRTAAEEASRSLTGRVDRGFAEAAPAGYQSQEIAEQRGVIGDQQAGGGGTVTNAPSMESYLADKLRRENPLEVDGYAFLGGFETFLDMIGGR